MDHITDFELKLSDHLKDKTFRDDFFKVKAQHEIARQLRKMRALRNNMRQEDLAKLTGMSQSAVSRIEQADYSGWTFKTLCKLASALDTRLRIVFDLAEDVIRDYEREENDDAKASAESGLFRNLGVPTNPVLGRPETKVYQLRYQLDEQQKRNPIDSPIIQRLGLKDNETSENNILAVS